MRRVDAALRKTQVTPWITTTERKYSDIGHWTFDRGHAASEATTIVLITAHNVGTKIHALFHCRDPSAGALEGDLGQHDRLKRLTGSIADVGQAGWWCWRLSELSLQAEFHLHIHGRSTSLAVAASAVSVEPRAAQC